MGQLMVNNFHILKPLGDPDHQDRQALAGEVIAIF